MGSDRRGNAVLRGGAILALLLGPACGMQVDRGGARVAAAAGARGDTAPDFTLSTPAGERVSLSQFAGEVRLVDFWATWCAPCREEIPMLNELQASYGDRGFRILAIAEEDAAVLSEFAEKHAMEYTNLVDTAGVTAAYAVLGLPTAYLLDRDGKIVDSYFGPKPAKRLEEKIRTLLDAAETGA